MDNRYYLDPETQQPHIYGHGVTEAKVEQVLRNSGDALPRTAWLADEVGTDGRGALPPGDLCSRR